MFFRSAKMLLPVALSFSAVSPALAQLEGGIITGSVHDSSGAVIVKASVNVVDAASGVKINLTTNDSGSFTTSTLRPGTYQVSVSAPGFQTTVQKDVILQIASKPIVNLILAVGETQQTVEVDSTPPAMQLTEASVGTVVEGRSVQELPLNGRSAMALVLVTPGVRSNSATNAQGFADRGTSVSDVNINNGPGSMNGYLLDGISNISVYSGEIAINASAAAIQEFKVMSGYMSAEFGLTGGGVIAMSTRSGSNQLHGDVYEYLRNDYLDARDWFLAPTSPKAPLRYNQYGGSVGGPVLRNRLFFFGNYEEFRYKTSKLFTGSVPTATQRAGDFSSLVTCSMNAIGALVITPVKIYDPNTTMASGNSFTRIQFPGNVINRPLDPVAVNFQKAFYPLPNITSANTCQALTNTNNYQVTKANTRSMRQTISRADYIVSGRQSLFGRFAYYNHFTDNGDNWGTFLTAAAIGYRNDQWGTKNLVIGHTFAFTPSLINEFRAGVTRTIFPFKVPAAGQDLPPKLGFPSNVPSDVLPNISGNGLPSVNGQAGQRNTIDPQIVDTVTFVRGRHSLRIGTHWQLPRANNNSSTNIAGTFSFSSSLTNLPSSIAGTGNAYASFLLGAVNSASLPIYSMTGFWSWAAGGFIQDDWKITSRLTLNAGLRYDFQAQRHEHHNGFSNFAPNAISPSTGLKGTTVYANVGGYGPSFVPNDPNNWGPRLGFAWDVFGDGKTSVRAGFGIYYVNMQSALFNQPTAGFGSTTTSYASSNPGIISAATLAQGYPSAPLRPLGAAGGPDFLLGQSATYQSPIANTPMSQQWNLYIQRELPGRFVVDVGYSGNHGVHMVSPNYNMNSLRDADLRLGLSLTQNVPNPYAGKVPGTLGGATITRKQSLLPYPYYNSITVNSPRDGNLHGNTLNVSVQRHANSGLTLMTSYSLSKMLDNGVSDGIGPGFLGISSQDDSSAQNPNNRAAEYSLDPMDIKHRIVVSALYDLPFGRGQRFLANSGGLVNRLIGGWQLNAVIRVQSGLPLMISGANNGIATRPSWAPGKSAKDVNLSKRGINGWFDTTVFMNPDSYTYGNVPRVLPNSRAPKYANLDASLFKTVKLTERVALQLHLEAFNAFNHPNFGSPNTNFVPASGNNGLNTSSSFGTITSTIQPRNVQLAAKIIF